MPVLAIHMRKKLILPVVIATLLVLASYMARSFIKTALDPVDAHGGRVVLIEIPVGLTAREVAIQLHEAGLIRDARLFGYYARYRHLDNQMQGGEYQISTSMSAEQILQRLAHGEVYIRRFTIPEGLTIEEIATQLAARHIVDKQRFLRLAATINVADAYLPSPAERHMRIALEGYLFPSTYDYKQSISEEAVLAMMFARFERVWTPELRARAAELNLTVHQVMTLASIIEKEAKVASERAVISGVYHNRLRQGMKLDADPTVRYAQSKQPEEPLLLHDLEADSPYNTYLHPGLPPGPIAAPGESAIRAALYPAKHNFLFFVARADGSGEHYFAVTLEEQNQNMEKAAANAVTKR